MRAGVLLAVGLVGACVLGRPASVPARVGPFSRGPEVDRQVAAARLLFERGHAPDAMAALEPLLAGHPEAIDGQRLRQDVLRTRGRMGLLRAEAAARVAARPDDAMAHYLQGRVLPAGSAQQRRCFERAARLQPDSPYPWLGYAYSLRESPAESLSVYQRLYRASREHPTVASAYAWSLRVNGKLREAVAVYQRLRQFDQGSGALGLARTMFALGGRTERLRGFGALLDGLRLRPFDPLAQAVIGELLRVGLADRQVEQIVDVLRESPERMVEFGRGTGLPVLVALLQRLQLPHAALAALLAGGESARRPGLRRQQRRLRLAIGDVAGFLTQLAADLPRPVILDESNQVGALWRSLLEGPWRTGAPLADVDQAVALTRALRDVGLLVEAEMVVGIARRRLQTDAASLAALADEVRRELSFENELRRLIHGSYDPTVALGLDDLLARLRAASVRILGEDIVGEDARFFVPLVGEMLDPFAAGLCLHLQRYNRHLVLGRRSGAAPEGLSFTRLSVRDLPVVNGLELPGRCREVIGIDRDVESLSGVLGGDLAGVALLSHYVIDYDAVTEWARGLADRRRIVAADREAALQDGWTPASGLLEPLDVAWRLAAMSPVQDSELDQAVLEMIRLHERQHLVDSFHYLPIEANLWRGIGLLLEFGLSASAVEGEMERRAELAALALSRHPELVLAHVADFLGQRDRTSPHVRGFGELGRQLVAELQRQGLSPAAAAVGNWHRLDLAVVRQAAAALIQELP